MEFIATFAHPKAFSKAYETWFSKHLTTLMSVTRTMMQKALCTRNNSLFALLFVSFLVLGHLLILEGIDL